MPRPYVGRFLAEREVEGRGGVDVGVDVRIGVPPEGERGDAVERRADREAEGRERYVHDPRVAVPPTWHRGALRIADELAVPGRRLGAARPAGPEDRCRAARRLH